MKSFLTVVGRVIGILAVIALLVAGAGVALGYIYVGIKQPAQETLSRVSICSDSDVDKYNELANTPVRDNSELPAKAEKIQSFVDELKADPNFSDDATCVFMAYTAAVTAQDADAAQKQFDTLKGLAGETIYPSNRIIDISSIESMQARINALNSPETNSSELGSG